MKRIFDGPLLTSQFILLVGSSVHEQRQLHSKSQPRFVIGKTVVVVVVVVVVGISGNS